MGFRYRLCRRRAVDRRRRFQTIQALAAIVNDEYLVVAPNYIYTFDLTAWGWIHLLVGLALVAIGVCLLLGQGWALIAGIVVAAISALINFTWLPYSPLWAILVIAVDVLIIWALASARAPPGLTGHPASEHHSGQLTRQHPQPKPGPSAAVRHPGRAQTERGEIDDLTGQPRAGGGGQPVHLVRDRDRGREPLELCPRGARSELRC